MKAAVNLFQVNFTFYRNAKLRWNRLTAAFSRPENRTFFCGFQMFSGCKEMELDLK